jgi:hypothetical protein
MQGNQNKKAQWERPDLDRRYGEIGISAVAAALQYRGDAKNPAYAPAPRSKTEREEVAA